MRMKNPYLATTLAALAACGVANAAVGDPVEVIDAVVSPKKLPSSGFRTAKLQITSERFFDDGSGADDTTQVPPRAIRAVISLADNLQVNPSSVPECKANLNGLSTEAAISTCSASRISTANAGRNTAVAALPVGPGDARVNFDLTVTTFNGPQIGGKPTILLHTYSVRRT